MPIPTTGTLKALETIQISRERLVEAAEQGKDRADDWQAQLVEIFLMPEVNQRWHELNPNCEKWKVDRHDGAPFRTGDYDNEAKEWRWKDRWSEVNGYTLGYGYETCVWNSVRDDYYGHCASSTWRGIRETTKSLFVYALWAYIQGHEGLAHVIEEAGVEIVD